MSGLDTRYIPINTLQQYFVNKDDGTPLAAGKVYFYRDVARQIPKPVYELGGTPPDYTYSVLDSQNGLTLSSVGTFIDQNGSDISVYLYPYDDNNNLDLYYIAIYDANGHLQETREAVPNLGSSSNNNDITTKNYIPNGQFLLHNDVNNYDHDKIGLITEAETAIAQGGWYFRRPNNSTATDYVTFEAYGSILDNPAGFPRFYCRTQCTVPSLGDAYKALSMRFEDVTSFASSSQYWTLSFSAINNAGGSTPVSIVLVKNFGDGGSATQTTTITPSILITNAQSIYNIPFVFGTNEGSLIGNNSYVSIDIELPTGYISDISFTDFSLTIGNSTLTGYPFTPKYEVISNSLSGLTPLPDPSGFNLYLPIILTKTGFRYDDSIVGTFVWSMSQTKQAAIYCDGSSYSTDDFSPEGIPYKRLWNKWNNANGWQNGLAMFGTGYFAYTASIGKFHDGILAVYLNVASAQTNMHDGAIPTGFTFTTLTNIEYESYVAEITNFKAGNAITAGSYFVGYVGAQQMIFWYTVDGNGAKPNIANAKFIKIDCSSSYTIADTQWRTMLCINAAYVGVPDFRGFFPRIADTINSNGVDPDAQGRILNVTISNGGSNYQINDKVTFGNGTCHLIVTAIGSNGAVTNVVFYGYGYNYVTGTNAYSCTGGNGSGLVINATAGGYRIARPDGISGAQPGTQQFDIFGSHNHSFTTNSGSVLSGQDEPYEAVYYHPLTDNTSSAGGNETRPKNISFNLFVLI